MFACPKCKELLTFPKKKSSFLSCFNKDCNFYKYKFPFIHNIPLLIPFGEKDCIFKKNDLEKQLSIVGKDRNLLNKTKNSNKYLKNWILGSNIKTKKNFEFLIKKLKKDANVLIIGGGTIGHNSNKFYDACKRKSVNIISVDVYYSKLNTVIADAHYLPFKNNSFKIVIIQAVLEHVINPYKVVNEIFRVLENDGLVYSETPFLQSVHEGPFDFIRFTHSGHRWLFRNFKEKSSGFIQGAFSSILFVTCSTVSGLLRNKLLSKIIMILFSRICKFLDNLINYEVNIDNACGCYFLGSKSKNYFDHKLDIIDYYKKSQRKPKIRTKKY